MSRYARETIQQMAGYVPGEQPRAEQRVVKLNTNENPYPPSPKVMAAISSVEPDALRRYPSAKADAFRELAAEVHGVTPDMVLAGNGSDDILTILTRTFAGPGRIMAHPMPTYSLYPVLARLCDARSVTCSWEADWQLPIQALADTEAAVVFVANPNAPSGTVVPASAIEALAQALDGVVVVDEAYTEFSGHDCVDLVHRCENVVVCRTLSKAYSLAGLRFGYALAPAALIEDMAKVKDSYNCDAISIAAACAALEDREHAEAGWRKIRQERERMVRMLQDRGFVVVPSQANFLLASPPGGEAEALVQRLRSQGILVRYFDDPDLRDKVRITIGTPADNDVLLAAL